MAEVCRECKIEFIGPSVDAMAKLGDKVSAKEIAKQAQVNLVPGLQLRTAPRAFGHFDAASLAKDTGTPLAAIIANAEAPGAA